MRTLLKGFTVCGKNCELHRRCVLIENDTIIAVEPDITGSIAADKTIIFKDAIISPGFIDTHGHSDISILAYPDGFSKRHQGFVTEITGNCGLSPFPLTDCNREHLQQLYSNYQIPLRWSDLDSYIAEVTARKPLLNIAPLCGHNTLRAAVAGYEKEELSPAEIKKMCALLADCFAHGALGLSSGLLYVPGCFASENELFELMRCVAGHGKVYTTHLKSEGDNLIESLTSTLELARQAGVEKVMISHFKTAGAANFGKLDAALELIAQYRDRGIQVCVDRYPYIESQTQLSIVMPPPWQDMGDTELTCALAGDETAYQQALSALREFRDEAYWQRMRLTGTTHPHYRRFCGKKFYEITDDPAALVLTLLAHDSNSAMLGAAGMSEENMRRIISQDFCFCGSDGNALPGNDNSVNSHPRAFGAAAKFARLLLDMGMDPGKVCYKMSTGSAEFFALDNTGIIAPGKRADITVFDPETIDSRADFTAFNTPAEGISLTVCNGVICCC